MDNIQIEGTCREIGLPRDHAEFAGNYELAFPGSFNAYSRLGNERLFEVTPTFIQLWVYEDDIPYIEWFDLRADIYQKRIYPKE